MSAIAGTRTPEGFIMLSEGIAQEGTQTIRQDFKKIHKLNDNIGFYWLGVYPGLDCMDRMADELPNSTDINTVARKAGKVLKDIYQPMMQDWDGERFLFILVNSNGDWRGFDSDENRPFTPMKQKGRAGGSIYFGYGFDANHGQQYMQNTQQAINSGLPVNMACHAGFSKLMKSLRGQGIQVGTNVFQEVLTA